WKDSRLYQQLLNILNEGNPKAEELPESVERAWHMYQELLDEKKYLDYSTILVEAINELMSNNTLREKISGELKYLVVDEYQDVNPLQETLITELHALGANVCVVGDDDQTIYQWRGSDVQNIITFKGRYPNVKQIALNENFRSSTGVVISAQRVVETNPE